MPIRWNGKRKYRRAGWYSRAARFVGALGARYVRRKAKTYSFAGLKRATRRRRTTKAVGWMNRRNVARRARNRATAKRVEKFTVDADPTHTVFATGSGAQGMFLNVVTDPLGQDMNLAGIGKAPILQDPAAAVISDPSTVRKGVSWNELSHRWNLCIYGESGAPSLCCRVVLISFQNPGVNTNNPPNSYTWSHFFQTNKITSFLRRREDQNDDTPQNFKVLMDKQFTIDPDTTMAERALNIKIPKHQFTALNTAPTHYNPTPGAEKNTRRYVLFMVCDEETPVNNEPKFTGDIRGVWSDP